MQTYSRKLRRIVVTGEALVEICKERDEFVAIKATTYPLPQDAKVCYVMPHFKNKDCVDIVVESSEFSEVDDGAIIPVWPAIQFEAKYVK